MKNTIATLTLLPLLAGADDLMHLSDEFGASSSIADWQRLNDVEGWSADQLQVWDIDTSAPGHMRLQPHSSGWFANLRGVLVFKTVTGDFVYTTRLTLHSRRNPAGPAARPVQSFSLAGLFAHAPRGITNAAPTPFPGGDPAWPPPPLGNAGHYTTDWQPNTDNYIFLSFGRAGSYLPNSDDGSRHQYEVKTTRNGNSNLYFAQSGVPAADSPDRNVVTLQMVRVGDTALVLRKHAGGPWIVENRYPNPDHPFPLWGDELQLGFTSYTDWEAIGAFNSHNVPGAFKQNYTVVDTPGSVFGTGYTPRPDLIADFDFVRFQRPDAALTEAALQTLATSYNPATNQSNHTVGLLPGDGLGLYLGDNAHTPLAGYLAANFDGSPPTDLAADHDGDGKATLIEYVLGSPPGTPDSVSPSVQTSSPPGSGGALTLPLDADATAATVTVEGSTDLASGWVPLALRPANMRAWTALVAGTEITTGGSSATVSYPAPYRFVRITAAID